MNTAQIERAYDDLASARKVLFNASFKEADLKFMLDTAEAAALLAGKITGKNPEERKASSTMMFIEDRNHLEAAEQKKRQAQMEFDIAKYAVDKLELIMRGLEWTKE